MEAAPDYDDWGSLIIPRDFTPTEYLIVEVLAARYRLGEATWPFPTKVLRALRSLEAKKFIGFKAGIVPYTKLAWLTEDGRKEALSDSYNPPVLEGGWPTECPACGTSEFGTTIWQGESAFSCGERDGCGHVWGARTAAEATILRTREPGIAVLVER